MFIRHLSGENIRNKYLKRHFGILRAFNAFLVWNYDLFRRTLLDPKIFLPISHRTEALETFHDLIGH